MSDEFVEPFFGFRIVKPAAWQFVPPAWSPAAQLRNAAELEIAWLQHAKQPFVCFMQHHDSNEHAYPTTQITARPSAVPPREVARQILDAQLALLGETYADFQLRDASTDRIIAGHHANSIVASFTLARFAILSRSFTVFTPGIAFTIGMSSSVDPRYFDEEDFELSLRSIEIRGR